MVRQKIVIEPTYAEIKEQKKGLSEHNELAKILSFCFAEWCKTHIVFVSPRMIELFGDVIDTEEYIKSSNQRILDGNYTDDSIVITPTITHICCCGHTTTRKINNGTTWHCLECNAMWGKDDDGTIILKSFSDDNSCLRCYSHELYNVIDNVEYITNHCHYARALIW